MKELSIRPLKAEDWKRVAHIYEEGIATGNATFQQEAPTWDSWDNSHMQSCRFVVEVDTKVVAWAALSKVSDRCVYAGVAEVSVYVGSEARGMKLGQKLLQKLITESENRGIWTLQAGIFPENEVSIYLHEKLGFRKIGYREKIGQMNGVWRDTVLLERRSKII
ncbi:GNAT family N-acetyltransferase [Sediminitomix flava]|uniref:Phosphinothricin acetyltransferase n=1 Tax=Sediminitomix flava TaxID=379075 RepID=A0A315Z6X4_SEDFL|nr:GNAT family N-acetyltransferase [Sediminitomix flava]PWJ39155.1 phosphinothricin acetyltransferase [Sediminitomix flava]